MTKSICLGFALMAGSGFADEKAKVTPEDFEVPPSWDVTCEVFSLPLSEAAKLKRKGKTDAEDYAELVKRVDAGKVEQEEFLMLRVVEGTGGQLEEISEMIYATEYEPPELPSEIGNLSKDLEKAKALITPATPSAFDTKNVGSTLEMELTKKVEGKLKIQMTMTLMSYLGRQVWGQGLAEAEMPRFAVQKVRTGLKVKPEVATLIGSISPPEALQPDKGEREVWLAFVTVSKSKE